MPKSAPKLSSQTVVITGAAQGLGRAVATAFHGAGSRVVLVDIDEKGLESLRSELGEKVQAYRANLADAEETQDVIARVLHDMGTIQTLVHNAAILVPEPFETATFQGWQQTINVGIQAAFLLIRAVWPEMKAAGGGCLIYVSSRSGIEGFRDESAYCTAKHGLEGLMKSLALEGADHGILAHTITPGMYMRTPMSERNYTEELKTKWVDPSQLAPAFLKLASRADPGLTGQRVSAWGLSRAMEE